MFLLFLPHNVLSHGQCWDNKCCLVWMALNVKCLLMNWCYINKNWKMGKVFLSDWWFNLEYFLAGKLRYANNSNYKNDVMIRKEVICDQNSLLLIKSDVHQCCLELFAGHGLVLSSSRRGISSLLLKVLRKNILQSKWEPWACFFAIRWSHLGVMWDNDTRSSLYLVYHITLFWLPQKNLPHKVRMLEMESVFTAFVIIWIFCLEFNSECWQIWSWLKHT